MAQRDIQLDEDKFICSICLDLLKYPVTIPCGHSYCLSCIKNYWDEEDAGKIHKCPQCRQTFIPRPVLVKNSMLADLMEELKRPGVQSAPTGHSYAGPGDVACDVCSGRKVKAIKSCLVCLVSYCDFHLQPHYESPAFYKHKLVDPFKKLRENTCPRHGEVMKIFCRTDQQCICYLCTMEEHKDHNTVSAAAERTERQRGLGDTKGKIQQRLKGKEKEVMMLQQTMKAINPSAGKAVTDSDKIFTEMVCLIQNRRADVKQKIQSRQKTDARRAAELREKLEREIAELRRKETELEQLSDSKDDTHFLLNYPSLSQLTGTICTKIRPLEYFENLLAAVSEASDKLQDMLSEDWPKTRADFLQYSRYIAMDPNTVGRNLLLSKRNRKVTLTMNYQDYPDHPERFEDDPQVLSKEALTGRCYLEVEWSGIVTVAVAYKDSNCLFGYQANSWALDCSNSCSAFRHNNIKTFIPGPQSSRVGVYVDHEAGDLSFYSVSETMTLLHSVQTTFTQPLYLGLLLNNRFSDGDTAEVCKLN
ncbi:tripartite motif-containing protein 16-like [Symphorus nematophorus]